MRCEECKKGYKNPSKGVCAVCKGETPDIDGITAYAEKKAKERNKASCQYRVNGCSGCGVGVKCELRGGASCFHPFLPQEKCVIANKKD